MSIESGNGKAGFEAPSDSLDDEVRAFITDFTELLERTERWIDHRRSQPFSEGREGDVERNAFEAVLGAYEDAYIAAHHLMDNVSDKQRFRTAQESRSNLEATIAESEKYLRDAEE